MKSFPILSLVAEQKNMNFFTSRHSVSLCALLTIPFLIVFFLTTPHLLTLSFAAQANTTVAKADLYRMPIPVQLQLVAHTKRYVNNIANNVFPSSKRKNVIKRGNQFIARYLIIDTSSAAMEALPLEKGKNYKAIITYHELEYQCRGATKKAALNGQFNHVKTRRLIEILHYQQGRWR